MLDHPAVKLFIDLLLPSLSGDETRVAEKVRSQLDEIGYAHVTDPAGNILVHLPGKDPGADQFVFAAHMDEIGMVVTRIDEDGNLHVTRSGGLYPWKLGEGPVDILGDVDTIRGILAMGSTHTKEAENKSVTWAEVRILTGLEPNDLTTAGIRPGTPVLPCRERRGPVFFGPPDDPLIGAWTFDDRMGCVALLRLLLTITTQNLQPYHPTTIAFTTREEIGGHGAKYLVRSINPEVFIAIDGCPVLPGEHLKLDGRPGIWTKDSIAHYDKTLIHSLMEAAIQAGTEIQPVTYNEAASDASLVSYSLGVPRIGCIGHVRDNSHGYEIARLSVFDHLLDTLTAFISTYRSE